MPRTGSVSLRTLLAVQSEVARLLTGSPHRETTPAVLELLGSSLDCPVALAWGVNRAGNRLRHLAAWCDSTPGLQAFVDASAGVEFALGEGLPGEAWETGTTCWITDLSSRPQWPRSAEFARAQLGGGVSFPIIGAGGVGGVVELYSSGLVRPTDDLLAMLDALGRNIGQWTDRLHAESEMRSRQARHSAILASALDGIITINGAGRVLEFNAAAEQMFGISQKDALGRELAELVVPTHLRESHRAGIERAVSSGRSTILGQRIETVGCRADGAEFPVELTITRLPVPGPPVFTGHLRDITERVTAALEIRASRIRIVEGADAERLRIQRNLHDGAQQRLTALAIALGQARKHLPANVTAAQRLLSECDIELAAGIRELRDLSRGMHPEVLHDLGLEAGIRDLLRRCPLDAVTDISLNAELPQMVEAAAYYTVAEALTNAVRHSQATTVSVSLRLREQSSPGLHLRVTVSDDGQGGAEVGSGSGLRGLGDRVSALGGTLEIWSPVGGGTSLTADLPAVPTPRSAQG